MIENFKEAEAPGKEIIILCFGDEQEEPEDRKGDRGFSPEAWETFV